jgi:peptidoglycan/LPS O-acetylase OafA/YrhL
MPEPVTTEARFTLGYRPALDGVRAIGVISVMAFHGGFKRSYGGYLGVDVFFVLSGFLITSLLVAEHDSKGNISLTRFYSRRMRRLLPALFVMLAAVAIYAHFADGNGETLGINRDVIGTVLYVANWVAMSTYGFTHNMLSHTWSLSIEEQFYFVWPIVVLLLLRWRTPRWAIVTLTGVGFLLSCLERAVQMSHVRTVTPRIFFGTDTRGGTLLAGCFLALVVSWDVIPRAAKRLAVPAMAVGLVALAFAFTSFRYAAAPNGAFSEGITLVAVATMLVIFGAVYAPSSALGRVLSFRPIVWIGKVSYGLYLWHVPVDRIFREGGTTLGLNHFGIQCLRLAITLSIVTVSFYVLERPIRHGWRPQFAWARAIGAWFNRNPKPGRVVVFASVALVVSLLIAGLVHTSRTTRAAANALAPAVPGGSDGRPFTLSPATVAPGGLVAASGDACPGAATKVVFALEPAGAAPILYGDSTVKAGGTWQAGITVPPTAKPGTYVVKATCKAGGRTFAYADHQLRVG